MDDDESKRWLKNGSGESKRRLQNGGSDGKQWSENGGGGGGSNDDESAHMTLLKNVTVEPMMFPYLVATVLVILANQNLNIQKACRTELDLSAAVCAALENKDQDPTGELADSEVAVQKLVADMLIWQTVLQNAVPAVFVLFLGSWSDRNRWRRPCMLLPIYGEIVKNVGLLVCVHYFQGIGMNVTGLWQSLPMAVTGYWTVMFMAVMSYIGDISTVRSDTRVLRDIFQLRPLLARGGRILRPVFMREPGRPPRWNFGFHKFYNVTYIIWAHFNSSNSIKATYVYHSHPT